MRNGNEAFCIIKIANIIYSACVEKLGWYEWERQPQLTSRHAVFHIAITIGYFQKYALSQIKWLNNYKKTCYT